MNRVESAYESFRGVFSSEPLDDQGNCMKFFELSAYK